MGLGSLSLAKKLKFKVDPTLSEFVWLDIFNAQNMHKHFESSQNSHDRIKKIEDGKSKLMYVTLSFFQLQWNL
jgi:hypothetical protein